jgi:CrcB protein
MGQRTTLPYARPLALPSGAESVDDAGNKRENPCITRVFPFFIAHRRHFEYNEFGRITATESRADGTTDQERTDSMSQCFLVGAGGFIGAAARYLVMQMPLGAGVFPIKTLLINFIGALAVGILTEMTGELPPLTSDRMLFLEMGICGGFTAFSAFGLETVMLFEDGRSGTAYLYIALSIGLCLAGVVMGRVLVKTVKG